MEERRCVASSDDNSTLTHAPHRRIRPRPGSGSFFTDDSSPYFPIRSKDPGDGAIANGRPTLIFIGTSHCWNTAREAERIVTLYPRYKDNVHFYRN
jgi:hypothetical protein